MPTDNAAPLEVLVALEANGRRKKFLTLARRRTGIYFAMHIGRWGGVHTSYHNDGSYFFRAQRIEGPDPPPMMRTPLNQIQGEVQMGYWTAPAIGEFDRLPELSDEHTFSAVLTISLVDLNARLDASIHLIEPGHEQAPPAFPGKQLLVDRVFMDAHPWIRLLLMKEKLTC